VVHSVPMQLTHFGHACVLVQTAAARILIDPGTLSAGFEDAAGLDALLITHQHADHLDLGRLAALISSNPGVQLVVDSGSAGLIEPLGLTATVVEPGDRLPIAGSVLEVVGGAHALVHADIPVVANAAYVLDDGAFFHPGDSYFVPPHSVDVLGLPVSGPWLKVGEAIDYVRTVAPRVAVPIHEAALSSTATHYGMLAKLSPARTSFSPLEPATPRHL
jgi:L-ascorbate metabolism protein UlaG (beta-lactamase superfamily)